MTTTTRRRLLAAIVLCLMLGLVVDLLRAPERQWSAALLLVAIDWYQARVSPQMETAGVRCRFAPSCSRFAETVICRDGTARGLWRTAGRLARCGPWTAAGTQDVP